MNQKENKTEKDAKINSVKEGFYKIFAPFKVALKKFAGVYKDFFESKDKDDNYFDHLTY